ncbi:glycosyltransferase [Microbacterium sp. zg.B48]|uniref:glycosyltransferase n=1 Tax=Microbacterium sp. zg.B48 TaxID=2969408 RepID=UPI00214BE554|nr:glycosyltransferase [Microbacterium sp. zg.B48]MCR2765128.1 glycosyltransferase [Microbacterium sp. zg.B48]
MSQPVVDVTIAVHSATRPIARAVASIVDHTEAPVRVNVVAHNIDPEVIRENLGAYASHPQVRLLALRDGVYSPAGPMNHGLDHSDARFVAVMGSDDEFAPGAVDSWLALQRETGASTVLARVRIGSRGIDPYPPVRRGRRTRHLSAHKDRLAYRSAPLGLIERARFGDLRFTEGLPSGEDLAYSATLWFTGRNLAYDLTGPEYIINDDAGDRVTFAPRPVPEDFAFLDAIEATEWFGGLSRPNRRALAVKILRVHFFDAVLARTQVPEGIGAHRHDLIAVLDRIETIAPGVTRLLARVDRRVIDEVRSASPDPKAILHFIDARWNYRTIGAMLPRNPFLTLHRQAPFRTLYAGMRAMSAV